MAKEYEIAIRLKAIVEDVGRKFKQVTASLSDLGRSSEDVASSTKIMNDEMGKVQQTMAVVEGAAKQLATGIVAYFSYMATRGVAEMVKVAATNLEIARGFENLTARAGLAGSQVVKALQRASKGTVDEYNLMLQANKALRLGVATTVEEFEQLMKIAYVRAKEFGISVAEAWEYIVVGIGRASPMILDNLGILMDAETTYREYAESIGTTADKLTVLQQKEAIRNRILREGIPDLEKWVELGDSAADSFARWEAAAAGLRQELGEAFLPAITQVVEKLATLPTILDQLGFIVGSNMAGIKASLEAFVGYLKAGDWDAIVKQKSVGVGQAAMIAYARIDAANKGIITSYADLDIKLHDTANAAREAAAAQDDTAQRTEAAAQRTQNAKAAWMDYLNSVAAANQQFANQVAAAQFRAAQAAAQAAFRLQQIEASYQQQRAQAIASAGASIASAVASADDRIRQIRRELLDDLADMEWEYQRQRTEAVKEAPWWIRQALASEYAERERIRQSGDAEELAAFDKNLREKIRAIDPVYAEELDKMDEQYQHKRDITRRDARQAMDDARDAVANQTAAMEAGLANQLAAIEANYQRQKEAWEFQNKQRLEAEKFAMSQIQTTQSQKLDEAKAAYIEKMKELNVELAKKLLETTGEYDTHGVGAREAVQRAGRKIRTENNKHLRKMKTDVGDRLEEIEPKFEHWGGKHWRAYRRAWIMSMRNNPLPPPREPGGGGGEGGAGNGNDFQRGAWQIPRDMWAMLHRGEMVVPAPAAERIRRGEGGVTIIIENLTLAGAISPMNAAMFADELGQQLGRRMLQRGV